MPNIVKGTGYELHYQDGGGLVARLVEFGVHDLAGRQQFEASVAFHQRAAERGIQGVAIIAGHKRDGNRNYFYPLSGFDTDLYQLVKEGSRSLEGAGLLSILEQIAGVLAEVRRQFQRTHGRLQLQSVLLRLPDRDSLEGARAALIDFWVDPDPPAAPAPDGPVAYEAEDLRALGQIVIGLATGKLETQEISRNHLPGGADEGARQNFGRHWPGCRQLAADLIGAAGGTPIPTLEVFQQRLAELTGRDGPKLRQAITFSPLPERIVAGDTFAFTARAASGLPVTVTVASGRATIRRDEVRVTGAGAVTLKATQAGNEKFLPVEESKSFSVAKRPQAIQFDPPGDRILGDAPFALNAAVDSPLPVQFRLEAGPAEINGRLVTLKGPGRVTVCASQGGNDDYEPALEVRQSFEVAVKTQQTIQFPPLEGKIFGDAPFRIRATASSGLPVTFAVVSGLATVRGDEVTLTGAGVVSIKATQAGNDTLARIETIQSFNVAKAGQGIRVELPAHEISVGRAVAFQAVASSGLRVYSRIVRGAAILRGAELIAQSAGTIEIEFTQPGDDNYLPAQTQQTLNVVPAGQAITFAPLPREAAVGDAVPLRAEATSGLPVSFSVVSGGAEIAGGTLTLQEVGEVKIRAAQSGDANYHPAPEIVQSLAVVQAKQTIAVDPWPRQIFVGDSFPLRAEASSRLPVQFRLLSGNAELRAGEIKARGAGSVELQFEQPGDRNFQPARLTQSFRIDRRAQAIDFPEIKNRTVNAPVFSLEASATSGLPVTFQVIGGAADINGREVTLRGPGTVKIIATQPGDEEFEAAPAVEQTFGVIDPRRRRKMAVILAISMLLGALAAVGGWWLQQRALREKELNVVREKIKDGDAGQVLEALGRAKLSAEEKTALSNALRTVPVPDGSPPVSFQLVRGGSSTGTLKFSLPPRLPERGLLLEHLRWNARVEPATPKGVTLTVKPAAFVAGDSLELTLRAMTNAPTGTNSFALTLWHPAASRTITVQVVVLPPLPEIAPVPEQFLEMGRETPVPLTITEGSDPARDLTLGVKVEPTGRLRAQPALTPGAVKLMLHPLSAGTLPVTVTVTATNARGAPGRPMSFRVTIDPKNELPQVSAGKDQTIEQGQPCELHGSATDETLPRPDGRLTVEWSKAGGPGVVTFGNSNLAITTATFDKPGNYQLRLTARDGKLTSSRTSKITVNPVNQPPTVSIDPIVDIEMGKPVDLTARVTDELLPEPDKKLTVEWSRLNGPGVVHFGRANHTNTTATFATNGEYQLKLHASDGKLSTSATNNFTVTAVNAPPTITAPTNLTVEMNQPVSLRGVVTDDGLPRSGSLTQEWRRLEGAEAVRFEEPGKPNTTAWFNQSGTYELVLVANDGKLPANAVCRVVVLPANEPPKLSNLPPRQLDVSQKPDEVPLNVSDDRAPLPAQILEQIDVTAQSDNAGIVLAEAKKLRGQWHVVLTPKGLGRSAITVTATDTNRLLAQRRMDVTVASRAAAERASLINELAAFRIWFGINFKDKPAGLLNPAGYESLGVTPDGVPNLLSRLRTVPKTEAWVAKAKDLIDRCGQKGVLLPGEKDKALQNLEMMIRFGRIE